MLLYNQFVKPLSDEIQQQKQKDPEIIEELDRQLKYMEKTIGSFRSTTQKNHAKSINNIKKRTTDNKALIDELSQLREEQRARQRDLNRLDMQIQGVALKKKRLESDLDQLKTKIKDIKSEEEKVKKTSAPLWNTKDYEAEQLERDKRAVSRGKLQKGSMFKNKNGLKTRIGDLVN